MDFRGVTIVSGGGTPSAATQRDPAAEPGAQSGLLYPGVILDRDGTLIDVVRDEETGTVGVAFHPSHLRLLPGVLRGLGLLVTAGYRLCVATNQPGPAKGQFSVASVENTHAALLALLAKEGVLIHALEVCLHHPTGGPGGDPSLIGPCDCRKPQPGMLRRTIARARLDPARTWMVGDSAADVEAARGAGVKAALVFPRNRCELCPLRNGPSVVPDVVADRFDEVVLAILGRP